MLQCRPQVNGHAISQASSNSQAFLRFAGFYHRSLSFPPQTQTAALITAPLIVWLKRGPVSTVLSETLALSRWLHMMFHLRWQQPNKCIWTLPTSSEQSLAFARVVSAVAFVYPACAGRYRPGHSVVRAAGAKRSIDPEDQHCYRPCSAAGLACSDSAAAHHNHKKTITAYLITPALRRALCFASCR